MKDEILIREFTRIFRCTPEMAPTYIKRVHERMGYEVPLETIVAALHQISPKRLTMDALIERLRKMERAPGRARKSPVAESGDPVGAPAGVSAKPALSEAEGSESPALRSPRPKGARSRSPERSEGAAEGSTPSAMTQISIVLTRNWERGRKQGLKPSVMTTDRFVKTVQSVAGAPRPSVARVLESVEKLDRLDVLLTPNLVADDINESDVE